LIRAGARLSRSIAGGGQAGDLRVAVEQPGDPNKVGLPQKLFLVRQKDQQARRTVQSPQACTVVN
jgi:hypothetical protein